MSPKPRIVAIDFGTRRVGVAVSDPLRLFAQPVGTFDPDEAVSKLVTIADRDGIETIIIGWPLTPHGTEGIAVRRVIPFANRLRKRFPEVDIIRRDERHSTQRAMETLVQAGVTKKGRAAKGRLDQAAAALILEEYLAELAS